MSTKKVGKTGKHGVRGGVGIRKKYLLATDDKSKKICPSCGTKDKIKREQQESTNAKNAKQRYLVELINLRPQINKW